MIIENPDDPRVQAVVDTTHAALRTSLRPLDHLAGGHIGGHYRIAVTSGLTTILNAADAIFAVRWTEPDRGMVLLRLRAYASLTTAFAAAQEVSLDCIKVLNLTANWTGGTGITIGNGNLKGRNMAGTRITDIRIAAAAALVAGTGVLDAHPFGKAIFQMTNTVGSGAGETLFDCPPGQEFPYVIEAGQGFLIRIGATQGATGVVRYSFVMDWAEIGKAYPS